MDFLVEEKRDVLLVPNTALNFKPSMELIKKYSLQMMEKMKKEAPDKPGPFWFRLVLCPDDTEDLVQETFIRAYEKIDTFKGESSFSTWVCRIGVNLALSFLRRGGKRNTLALPRELADTQDCSPQRNEETDQELKRIHKAIAQLPDKYRAVVVLSVVELPVSSGTCAP